MPIFLAVALTAGVVGLGAAVRTRGRGDRWVVAAIAVCTVVAAFLIAGLHDPDVARKDLVQGVVVGAICVCALPLSAYYALGRLVRNPVIAGAAWAVSLVPMGYWLFFAWIITLGLVSCPPDAYECPL